MSGREQKRRAKKRIVIDDTIAQMSDDDLRNLRAEIVREESVAWSVVNEVKRRKDMICKELDRRARPPTSHGLGISDHAVVRYLERHKGMDIAAIREEIGELAAKASGGRSDKYGIRKGDGLAFAVDDETGHVLTVLSDDMVKVLNADDFP